MIHYPSAATSLARSSENNTLSPLVKTQLKLCRLTWNGDFRGRSQHGFVHCHKTGMGIGTLCDITKVCRLLVEIHFLEVELVKKKQGLFWSLLIGHDCLRYSSSESNWREFGLIRSDIQLRSSGTVTGVVMAVGNNLVFKKWETEAAGFLQQISEWQRAACWRVSLQTWKTFHVYTIICMCEWQTGDMVMKLVLFFFSLFFRSIFLSLEAAFLSKSRISDNALELKLKVEPSAWLWLLRVENVSHLFPVSFQDGVYILLHMWWNNDVFPNSFA